MSAVERGSQEHNREDEDFFISLTIRRGPQFYGSKQPKTNLEIAEILKNYAAHSEGLFKELYSFLAAIHLKADQEVPGYAQGATGSLPVNANFGPCGKCLLPNGDKGRNVVTSVNNFDAAPDCYPCSPSNLPSG
jgi:hypothetical protein